MLKIIRATIMRNPASEPHALGSPYTEVIFDACRLQLRRKGQRIKAEVMTAMRLDRHPKALLDPVFFFCIAVTLTRAGTAVKSHLHTGIQHQTPQLAGCPPPDIRAGAEPPPFIRPRHHKKDGAYTGRRLDFQKPINSPQYGTG